LLLLLPSTNTFLLFADFAGFALGAAAIGWEWMHRERRHQAVAE
jgi:hypothetical protein